MNKGEFDAKVVLVTGAASGLGRAASVRFAQEGAHVCLVDINAAGLAETARTITDAGGLCANYCGDLGLPSNCTDAVNVAIEAFGRLDVLCNVAGILRFHALADVSAEDWNKLFAVNVTAPFFMTQAAMPHLVESKGNVVNVASTAAFIGQSYTAPYAATKAALLSLTKSLAMEFIKYATGSKPLAGMPDVAYGPTRKSSMPLADQSAAPHLPTAHLDKGIQAGSEFWADYGESLGEKFNEWLLK